MDTARKRKRSDRGKSSGDGEHGRDATKTERNQKRHSKSLEGTARSRNRGDVWWRVQVKELKPRVSRRAHPCREAYSESLTGRAVVKRG